MKSLAGTRALTRLALRLDRVRLGVWVLVIGFLPALTAAQYKKLYPTEASLAQVTGVISNPSLVAINGPLFRGGSIGALTSWKIMATELILIGLMAILTVIRHSRSEEETGRLELLRATVVGRHAPLTAALLTAGIASFATATVTIAGLAATGLPIPGAIATGVAIGVIGIVFAGIAAVAAQLTEGARSAMGIAAAVLGGAYLLRAAGDTGATWLSWMSPVGWGMRVRPYAGEQWWVLALPAALAAAATAGAYSLNGRRDLDAGLLPQRPGPASADASLGTAAGLAWRLHRGLLLGWTVGMALWGAVLGGAAEGIRNAVIDNSRLTDMLTRLGGSKGLVDAYLAAVLGITGLVVAAYTVQATMRLRAEESAGRLEPLLATRVGRIRWALSHLVFAVAGTTMLLAVTGVAAGVAYGSQAHDIVGQTRHLFLGAVVQAPATWVIAGFGVVLFGLAPRLAGLTWASLVACLLALELGEILGLSHWIVGISPFAHVPKLPGAPLTAVPLIWLSAIALALGAAGLAGFRQRDIG